MPSFRLRQVDRIPVDASVADAWAVARGFDLFRVSFFRRLVGLRVLPDRARARLRGRSERVPSHARIDDLAKPGSGFRLLHEDPGREIVVGSVGKFWQPNIEWGHVPPAVFAAYAEPGWGKLAWNLRVDPREGGAWITCDLRVTTADDASWTRFRRYFRVIGPFSRAIRRAVLRRIAADLGGVAKLLPAAVAGDDILPEARLVRTHSIVLEAPPADVWPKLARWQGTDKLAVLRVEPGKALIMGSPELVPGAHAATPAIVMTWAFALTPIGEDATQLDVRVRVAHDTGLGVATARSVLSAARQVLDSILLRLVACKPTIHLRASPSPAR